MFVTLVGGTGEEVCGEYREENFVDNELMAKVTNVEAVEHGKVEEEKDEEIDGRFDYSPNYSNMENKVEKKKVFSTLNLQHL